MSENQQDFSAAPYRIDQQLHQILYNKPARTKLEPKPEEVLPEPVYPQHPNPTEMTKREYQTLGALRTWKSWGKPYFKSRWDARDHVDHEAGSERLQGRNGKLLANATCQDASTNFFRVSRALGPPNSSEKFSLHSSVPLAIFAKGPIPSCLVLVPLYRNGNTKTLHLNKLLEM